jgi:hypothetical protein
MKSGGALRISLAFMLCSTLTLWGDVQLPAIFSDHMVLQKKAVVPIWGTASAGEAISVTLDGITARTRAGTDGKWQFSLNLAGEGAGPFEMIIQGANKLTVEDVAIGEVWLASGQSNMTMNLSENRRCPRGDCPVRGPDAADVFGKLAGHSTCERTSSCYFVGRQMGGRQPPDLGQLFGRRLLFWQISTAKASGPGRNHSLIGGGLGDRIMDQSQRI